MIPDELIERALHAYCAGAGVSHSTEAGMRSALGAVAADIWEQGYQAGVHDEWEYQHDIPDTGVWHNPYLDT